MDPTRSLGVQADQPPTLGFSSTTQIKKESEVYKEIPPLQGRANFPTTIEKVPEHIKPKMEGSDHAPDLMNRSRALKEGGVLTLQKTEGSDKTTNPVWFLASTGELTLTVPKDLEAVIKSRFSTSLIDTGKAATEIYKKILAKENENIQANKDPPLSSGDIEKILKENLSELGAGLPGELESVAENVLESFKKDTKKYIKDFNKFQRAGGKFSLEDSKTVDAFKMAQGVVDVAKKKADVIHELKARSAIPLAVDQISQRYINSALLSNTLDSTFGTDLSPKCTEQELQIATRNASGSQKTEKIKGVMQEKLVYVPLYSLSMSAKYNEPEGGFESFRDKALMMTNKFIDRNSFQEAVVRNIELADADFHAENVALVPMLGKEVVPSIKQLNPFQLHTFLEVLSKASKKGDLSENDIQSLRENLIEDGMKRKGADKESVTVMVDNFLREISGTPKEEALNSGKLKECFLKMSGDQGLKFEIKIFDVDRTMPSSNTKGVNQSANPIRNILMALGQSDDPISPEFRQKLLGLRDKIEDEGPDSLYSNILQKFDKPTADAFKERMELLLKSASEDPMTPRGLLWRVFPNYGLQENALRHIFKPSGEDTPYDIADMTGRHTDFEDLDMYLDDWKKKNPGKDWKTEFSVGQFPINDTNSMLHE